MGGVGTLKFLCEIFSITPYLSLAVGFPIGFLFPRLSCCPRPCRCRLPCSLQQLAPLLTPLRTTDELLLLLLMASAPADPAAALKA